jgi:hypothetical protein
MEKIIKGIIGMKSGSLTNELIDLFGCCTEMPTTSAFIQQKSKIKPEAFKDIFKGFSKEINNSFNDDMEILAVDGSKYRFQQIHLTWIHTFLEQMVKNPIICFN